jgi:hypothetical protein
MSLSKAHHQPATSKDSPEGVEIVPNVLISIDEEGGSNTNKNVLPEYDHDDDVTSSPNTKGTMTVKNIISSSIAAGMFAVVGTGAYQMGVNQAANKMTASMMKSAKNPSRSGKAGKKAGKAGKKVCLEYGFFNDVVAKGSSTPIGADGPNGASACGASPPAQSAVCCGELSAAYLSGNFDDAYECLGDPANGPVLVGNWWLQRDVNNGEIYFEEGAVCAEISATDLNSRTRFELWDDKYIGMPLGLFEEFKVDYNVISAPTTNTGYLNMYLRSAATSTNYYDCRFDFVIPDVVESRTLQITPDTNGVANKRTGSINAAGSCEGGTTTIKDYLTANPNAVMGVGNVEKYTFVLNTGSTNQNNSGQHMCWSDVVIQRVDEAGTKFFDTYEFTTL